MEEPRAGRRGCSVKTMNEQRPCAGLLGVAAPLWAELMEARPFTPGRAAATPRPALHAVSSNPQQMLTRISSSFNVKTQKYPAPSSLPRPPAASSRSSPWHRRKLPKGCDQLESLVCHRRGRSCCCPETEPWVALGVTVLLSGLRASTGTPLPSASRGRDRKLGSVEHLFCALG